jgi:hypothetical protein
MKPLMVGLCALGMWTAVAEQAPAAWNNVFQPTLFGRNRTTTSNYYVAPAVVYSSPVVAAPVVPVVANAAPACSTCNAPPQPNCNTSYTQRCYYQPVTTYETKSYYEPVTTYQTSYYYEPVTSYRYSAYYDPCSCGYQQVATPVTSYQLRAQSSPVQSWVQRCAQVPVTSYQKSCYWQPQTTCCQTTVGALIPAGAPVSAPVVAPVGPPSISPTPGAPPNIDEQRGPANFDKSYYPQQPQSPVTVPNTSWRPSLGVPTFPTTSPSLPPPPPPVKLDRIVVNPDATVEGQVVRNDNTPRPDAKIVFVSSSQPSVQRSVTANSAGRFYVALASGSWNVYLQGLDGKQNFYTRIDVNDTQPGRLTLVNR